MTRKHIVFDCAGVLFQWQPVQMLMRELPHLAPDVVHAQELAAQVFQTYGGDWGDFDLGTVAPGALVQRIAKRTGLQAADVQTVVDAVPRELQALPASVALLRRLRAAGHQLFYLSNMPAPYADLLEARNDFFSSFAGGVFSARVGLIKPDVAMFNLACQRFEAAPADLVFLDDHLPNVHAAQAAGWQALHFQNAAQAEAELHNAGWVSRDQSTR
jgi:putative hydrolase of the HAD superfamily